MTTIHNRPDDMSSALADVGDDAGRVISGVSSWLTTADHKRIGRAFMVSGLLMGVGALVVGLLLGLERMNPGDNLLAVDTHSQLFSLHRVGLSFLVVAPILLGLCVAVVPLQLGARSMALSRSAALGYWLWDLGALMVIIAYLGNGGASGGERNMVTLFLMGLALSALGLVAAAGALVVTVITNRAPGMRLERVPMLAWSALVGGLALVITLPVLIGDLIYLAVDQEFAVTAFGGRGAVDTLGWMGWAITQPATFILVIPALGAMVDILVTASGRRHPLRAGVLIGIGMFGTAALAGITQVAHVLPWGDSSWIDRVKDALPYALFNLLPILGVLITVAVGAMALKAGKPRISARFAFALLGGMCILGGATFHALTPILDLQLTGTVYEEGSFVLLTSGALLVALGAIAHWGPKLWGRTIGDKQLAPLALLGFLGAKGASLPLLLAGFHGQPPQAAGGFDYDLSPEALNAIAMAGQGLLLLTVVGFGLLALKSFTTGPAAGDDPWDGQTLEWATSSPPPANNFSDLHTVSSAEPLLDLKPVRSAD